MALVQGKVEDNQGLPVSKALIVVESGTSPYPDIAVSSDEKGHFIIDLPCGHFCLKAHSLLGEHGTFEYNSDNNKYLLIRLEAST
jgi:hypothetical protein